MGLISLLFVTDRWPQISTSNRVDFEKVATNAAHILDVHIALDGMQTVKGAHILNVHIALDGRQIVKGVSGNSLI